MKLVTIFRALGDETRLRILNLLQHGELCVCHIQEVLDLPQVKVSKHLAFLRKHGLVQARRNRQWVFYSLPERASAELRAVLRGLWDHAENETLLRRDLRRLRKLADSVVGTPRDPQCAGLTAAAN